jgi:hypothetical protein
MGKPTAQAVSRTEFIGTWKRTWGIETSQYPEERKSTETPVVVASEPGLAQWLVCNKRKLLETSIKVGDNPVRVKSTLVLE